MKRLLALVILAIAGSVSAQVINPEPIRNPTIATPSAITLSGENCYIEREPQGFVIYPKAFGKRYRFREWTQQELSGMVNHSTRLKPNAARSDILRKKEMWPGNLIPVQLSKPWVGDMGFKLKNGKWEFKKGYVIAGDYMFCDPTPVFYAYHLWIKPDGTRDWWMETEYKPAAHVSCGNPVSGEPVVFIQHLDNLPMEIVNVPGPTTTLKECAPTNVNVSVYVQVTQVASVACVPQRSIVAVGRGEHAVSAIHLTQSQDFGYFDFDVQGMITKYCNPGDIITIPPPPGLIGTIGTGPNNPEHGPSPFGGPYIGPPIVGNGAGGYKNANGG